MKIYFVNDVVDDMFRQCNFSEKEKEFIKNYAEQGGSLEDLISFADNLTNAMLGSATGALTAAMGSNRKKRKKAILKGALIGAGGGLLGGAATDSVFHSLSDFVPIPNVGAITGGGLAGYLTALHEDGDDEAEDEDEEYEEEETK